MFIERLTGKLIASLPTGIILDVQGIGYGLEIPLSTQCQLPKAGESISIWVYTHVKEDAIRLFGFRNFEDRQAFEILLSLSGVGPKVALAILSTLTVSMLEKAVSQADSRILEAVPGVGPRLAEKILLELKPKILKLKAAHLIDLRQDNQRHDDLMFSTALEFDDDQIEIDRNILFSDLRSALENLGYKEKTIAPILEKVKKENNNVNDLQDLMRIALKHLSSGIVEEASFNSFKTGGALGLDEKTVF